MNTLSCVFLAELQEGVGGVGGRRVVLVLATSRRSDVACWQDATNMLALLCAGDVAAAGLLLADWSSAVTRPCTFWGPPLCTRCTSHFVFSFVLLLEFLFGFLSCGSRALSARV